MYSIRENLPLDHVLCVHDCIENYVCSYQEEIQSQYFCKNEASLHVTILYRHACDSFDHESSSNQHPNIIKEMNMSS